MHSSMVRVLIGTGAKVPIGAGIAYKCRACGMTFNSKNELQAHKKAHSGKKQ
jgi:Zinc-finger of C2H2 type